MIMHKKIIVLLAIVLLKSSLFSQTKEEALRDANITGEATLKNDYSTVLTYTLPKVVEMMGGKENAVKALTNMMNQIKKDSDFKIEKYEVISVSDVIKEQGQYRCYVETKNQMKVANTRIKNKSYLFGIFDTNNKIWQFIEANKLKNNAQIDMIIPKFKTSLNIPDDERNMEKI